MDPGQNNQNGSDAGQPPHAIARRLTGDLWCVGCGYNLRGLSIRAMCPECGTPVRATILGVVDPKAHELAPLTRPRLTATALIVWAAGFGVAVLAVALMRGAEVLREVLGVTVWVGWAPFVGLLGLVASGAAGAALIRPHRRITRLGAVGAAVGVAAYVPLCLVYYQVYARMDSGSPAPFLRPGPLELDRSLLRLGMFAFVVVLILGLRSNVRGLAARSVIVRTGRADRQSMLAVLASFGVAALGDGLHAVSVLVGNGASDLIATVGTVFLSVGSVLVLVGVMNVLLDAVRLWPVISRPGVGLADVLEPNSAMDDRTGRTPPSQ